MTRAGLLAAPLAAAVLALAGCASSTSGHPVAPSSGSSTAGSAVTVTLPAGSAPSMTRRAEVPIGGELDVAYVHNDSPGYWKLTSAGSSAVLQPLPEAVTGCGSGAAGCPSRHRARFRALARGTTTVVWTFTGLGPGAPTANRNVVSIAVAVG